MTRAVALTADRAILNGAGGKEPLGVYGQAGQHVAGPIDIDTLIDAAGLDRGGRRAPPAPPTSTQPTTPR